MRPWCCCFAFVSSGGTGALACLGVGGFKADDVRTTGEGACPPTGGRVCAQRQPKYAMNAPTGSSVSVAIDFSDD